MCWLQLHHQLAHCSSVSALAARSSDALAEPIVDTFAVHVAELSCRYSRAAASRVGAYSSRALIRYTVLVVHRRCTPALGTGALDSLLSAVRAVPAMSSMCMCALSLLCVRACVQYVCCELRPFRTFALVRLCHSEPRCRNGSVNNTAADFCWRREIHYSLTAHTWSM